MTKAERRGKYNDRYQTTDTEEAQAPTEAEESLEEKYNISETIEILDELSLEEAEEKAENDSRVGIKKYIKERKEAETE